jgi:hypothetical protein
MGPIQSSKCQFIDHISVAVRMVCGVFQLSIHVPLSFVNENKAPGFTIQDLSNQGQLTP